MEAEPAVSAQERCEAPSHWISVVHVAHHIMREKGKWHPVPPSLQQQQQVWMADIGPAHTRSLVVCGLLVMHFPVPTTAA